MIKHIDIEKNFWEVNPETRYVFHYLDHDEENSRLL